MHAWPFLLVRVDARCHLEWFLDIAFSKNNRAMMQTARYRLWLPQMDLVPTGPPASPQPFESIRRQLLRGMLPIMHSGGRDVSSSLVLPPSVLSGDDDLWKLRMRQLPKEDE